MSNENSTLFTFVEYHRLLWRHAVTEWLRLPQAIRQRYCFSAVLRQAGLPQNHMATLHYRRFCLLWHRFHWQQPASPKSTQSSAAKAQPSASKAQRGIILIEFAMLQPLFLLLVFGGLTLMMAVVSREAVNASSFACALAMASGNGEALAVETAKRNLDSLAVSILPMGQPEIVTSDNGAKVNCQVEVDYRLFWFNQSITLSASTELSRLP